MNKIKETILLLENLERELNEGIKFDNNVKNSVIADENIKVGIEYEFYHNGYDEYDNGDEDEAIDKIVEELMDGTISINDNIFHKIDSPNDSLGYLSVVETPNSDVFLISKSNDYWSLVEENDSGGYIHTLFNWELTFKITHLYFILKLSREYRKYDLGNFDEDDEDDMARLNSFIKLVEQYYQEGNEYISDEFLSFCSLLCSNSRFIDYLIDFPDDYNEFLDDHDLSLEEFATAIDDFFTEKAHGDNIEIMNIYDLIELNMSDRNSFIPVIEVDLDEYGIEYNEVTTDDTNETMFEVITRPMSVSDSIENIEGMFEFISEMGDTDNQCGLHCSISYNGASNDLNFNKFIILMSNKDLAQTFTPRSHSGNLINELRTRIFSLVFDGCDHNLFNLKPIIMRLMKSIILDIEEDTLNILNMDNKMQSINFRDFNSSDGRIELRYIGGGKENNQHVPYETMRDEIVDEILRAGLMLRVANSPEYEKEFKKTLYKICEPFFDLANLVYKNKDAIIDRTFDNNNFKQFPFMTQDQLYASIYKERKD